MPIENSTSVSELIISKTNQNNPEFKLECEFCNIAMTQASASNGADPHFTV